MTQPAVVNFDSQPYSVELRDVEVPSIGPEDVLMEVASVGVCGSDLHMWTGDQSWEMRYPMILGHEFSGVVRQVGGRVSGWREGDRVVSETHAEYEANSPLTRAGLYNLDPTRRGFGAVVNGAMTHFVKVPARILHKIPDELSFQCAALTEPCCVAYNAVAVNSDVRPGDRVVVLGPGPIGILCAAMAKMRGAEVAVVGLEHDAIRLDVARQYGCHTLVGDPSDWAGKGDGLGVDGVIDATGVSASLQTGLQIVRPAGWITKVGWGRQPLEFSLDSLVQKNVKLQGSFSHNWPIWERVVRLLASGHLQVEPIIGGSWSIEKWQTAFETMHAGRIVKAVLTPDAGDSGSSM